MKKLLNLLAVLMLLCALMLTAVSCGGEQTPPNDNGGETPGDGEKPENPDDGEKPDDGETPTDDSVYYTITVKDDKDNPVPGIMVQMCEGENCMPRRTDDNGQAIYKVAKEDADKPYEAKFVNIPEGYGGDTEYYAFDEDHKVTLYIYKLPDGTAEYPFFLSEDQNEYKLPAAATLYFNLRGSNERYVVFSGTGFEVKYGESIYTPEAGSVKIMFISESTFAPCEFTVTNKTDAEITLSIVNEYIPGTSSAPIKVDTLGTPITATVTNGRTVYYEWTATKSGVLAVVCNNISNSITLYNTTSYVQTSATEGTAAQYVSVSVGDVVSVMVSAMFPDGSAADATRELQFLLNAFAATEAEPLPILLADCSYRIAKGSSITFSVPAVMTITVIGNGAKVTYDGKTVAADADGNFTFTLEEGKPAFTVENPTDENNDYRIKVY